MSLLDTPGAVPMLSAIAGSMIGAVSSMVSTWIAQRHRERREFVAQRTAQLEQLYSDFINESARLLVDAVQHSLEQPSTLVPIYALISRIRLRLLDRSDRERGTTDCDYSQGLYRAEPHSRGNSASGKQAQRSPARIQQCLPART